MKTNSVASALPACDLCRGPHANIDCEATLDAQVTQEQVNYVNNDTRQHNNPFSNTYNPGWRNHPNFSWREQAL